MDIPFVMHRLHPISYRVIIRIRLLKSVLSLRKQTLLLMVRTTHKIGAPATNINTRFVFLFLKQFKYVFLSTFPLCFVLQDSSIWGFPSPFTGTLSLSLSYSYIFTWLGYIDLFIYFRTKYWDRISQKWGDSLFRVPLTEDAHAKGLTASLFPFCVFPNSSLCNGDGFEEENNGERGSITKSLKSFYIENKLKRLNLNKSYKIK